MSRPLIPEATRQRQALAADPTRSAWVSANAGSGKTFVLARRVVRLLLAGTDPAKILCLTFTKAAAAEMATRVFEILGAWTALDDERLAAEIADIEGRPPDADRLARARHLFAAALETPGGLKIQTIHAFCEALLHQFPLEANVAGHFSVLDDRQTAELLAEARARVLHRAESEPDSPLGRALAFLIGELSDSGVEDVLAELVGKRDQLGRWIVESGTLDNALDALAEAFGVRPGDSVAAVDQEAIANCLIPDRTKIDLAEALETGSKSDRDRAKVLRRLALDGRGPAWLSAWQDLFLTRDFGPRKSLMTKAVADAYPDLHALMLAEQERLLVLTGRRRAALTLEGTTAILRLADAVLDGYEADKTRRGALDFEDLVVRTANLLARSEAAQWVQYKLDRGLDHILVDEAQDTSPRQWQVIQALAEEFFAGEGATTSVRTIFAVGDEKQSIYSFQGAVPAFFAEMRQYFAARAEAAGAAFSRLDLTLSFRSTPDVLGAVDTVFASPEAHKGLVRDPEPPVHEAIRRNDPGMVEIWPLEEPEEIEPPDDWSKPVDRISATSPMMRLARRIAATIAEWSKTGEADPGDVLVLVRKRGPFVEALSRELKRLDVAVAGADRLVLTEHIAVQDLVALGRFLLLPEDDLSLAAVLKSPLFGLTDDDLFDIAREGDRPRPGTLWQALVKRSDGDPRWRSVRARLETWRARADFMPPFEFYARLIGADGGRRLFRARLGSEVDDILDEFLALAISYETTGTPSLEGFLAWLRAAPTEIKRELSGTSGMVRIMTVHGAKGLEAPVVILVDPGAAPVAAYHDPAILERPRDEAGLLAPALVWLPAKPSRTVWHESALAALRDKAAEEYRRLLYVAMTRARDRLVVCGWAPKRGQPDGTWYQLVSAALGPSARKETDTDGRVRRLVWRKSGAEGEAPRLGGKAPVREAQVRRPDWLDRAVPPPMRPRRLQPSDAFEAMEAKDGPEQPPATSTLAAAREPADWARVRGRAVHRLLELLPTLDPSARPAAARRLLARALPKTLLDRADALAEETCALLADPRFAALFSGNALVEVPVVGEMTTAHGEAYAISGQIDRLCVTDDAVLIVDYKTDRFVPQSAGSVPRSHVVQLACYRHLLRPLYPNRAVRSALLYTSGPRLIDLPDQLLDDAITALASGAPLA